MSAAKWNLQRNVANARSGRMALQCRGSDDELIATFPGCDRDEANAHLIAAAPELLAFVQRLIRVGQFFQSAIELDNYGQDGADGNDLQQEAIRLIVKATGSAA